MSDPIKAALEVAAEAVRQNQRQVCHYVAACQLRPCACAYNAAAAAVAAFLRALPACDVMMPQNPDPRADDPGGPHSTRTLAAAVERAARGVSDG